MLTRDEILAILRNKDNSPSPQIIEELCEMALETDRLRTVVANLLTPPKGHGSVILDALKQKKYK